MSFPFLLVALLICGMFIIYMHTQLQVEGHCGLGPHTIHSEVDVIRSPLSFQAYTGKDWTARLNAQQATIECTTSYFMKLIS